MSRVARRIGTNALREMEQRRKARVAALVAGVRRAVRASRFGAVGMVFLAVFAACGWGALSWWHREGGGVLRAVECHGEIACGESLMGRLGLEKGMPMEQISLASVRAAVLDGVKGGSVSVRREIQDGLLVLDVKEEPLLAKFRPKGTATWWVLSSAGGVEPLDARVARMGRREDFELPLLEVGEKTNWTRVARFLERAKAEPEIWNDLSVVRTRGRGEFADVWLASGRHRVTIALDDGGIVALKRYRRHLENRPDLQHAKTVDMRFGGFAYAS